MMHTPAQKRPVIMPKEAYTSVKRDLHTPAQKRPTHT